MKVFIAAVTFLGLTLLFLFAVNGKRRGLRAPDILVDSVVEDNSGTVLEDKRGARRSLTVTKDTVDPKLGTYLTQMSQDFMLTSRDASTPQEDEYIAVDITFKRILDNERAKEVLRPAVEVERIECFQYMCSTRIPVSALQNIANIDVVRSVKIVDPTTDGGSFTTEGDFSMYADIARSVHKVTGSGLLIGVMSDSFNCLGGASKDIASGDLPSASNILILLDLPPSECSVGKDEGRAMMQLIYDVAPGARQAFRTGFLGQPSFRNGIIELATAGCDIIVDDIGNRYAPMFQDGIVAQAVNQVVAQGIPYFSSAGNNGRTSWDATNGFIPATVGSRVLHRFGTTSSGAPITRMRITMAGDGRLRKMTFQWDESFISHSPVGCKNDLDIFVYFNGVLVAQSLNDNIVDGDPVEEIQVTPSGGSPVTVEFEIERFAGSSPKYMKLVVYGQVTSFQYPTTNLGTSYGHANAASAAGVGAAYYVQTPRYGVAPPRIESTSSAGGVPIFFTKEGTRLSKAEIRKQPRFTGPDGGATTFFYEKDSKGVYRFFGTSAAAPHVAAVAALMLQLKGGRKSLTPAQIYAALEGTAVDMDDPFTVGFDCGFDYGTGTGLVDAAAALQTTKCPISFKLYNGDTNAVVATLTNGVTVSNPPPCGKANIEAVVPCVDSDLRVTLELVQGCTTVVRSYTDAGVPYFLFSNSGTDVYNGKIKAGSYRIRAQVNGFWSPYTSFKLGGTCA